MNEHCFIFCESSSDCEHCVFTCVLSCWACWQGSISPPVPHLTLQLLSSGEVLADPWGPKPMGEPGTLVEGPFIHGLKASLGIWLVPRRPPWGGHPSSPDRGLPGRGCVQAACKASESSVIPPAAPDHH